MLRLLLHAQNQAQSFQLFDGVLVLRVIISLDVDRAQHFPSADGLRREFALRSQPHNLPQNLRQQYPLTFPPEHGGLIEHIEALLLVAPESRVARVGMIQKEKVAEQLVLQALLKLAHRCLAFGRAAVVHALGYLQIA
ncbi:hypothetical protein [Hymenobacter coalescens]